MVVLIETVAALKVAEENGRLVTKQTIYNWCDKYSIGYKTATGRYLINKDKLIKLLIAKDVTYDSAENKNEK